MRNMQIQCRYERLCFKIYADLPLNIDIVEDFPAPLCPSITVI